MAGAPQFSTDRFALKLGLFYAAYFFFGGVQLPFFPLWLEARGLDARDIGLIIAVPALVRIIVTPIVTHQADRYQALEATLVIGSMVGLIGVTVTGLVASPIAILLAFAVAMAALSPMLSLSDAYALSGLGARERNYGPVRLWGSVAFIAGNVGAGFLLERMAPGHLIWLIVSALAVVVVAALALTPLDPSPRPVAATPAASPKTLLRNPAFLAVVLASSMVQGSHAFYYGFSAVQWRAEGLDGRLIGLLWGLGVLAEIVLFAAQGRLPVFARPELFLMLGAAGGALRWAAMALDPPAAALPALQLLHAASFGATHLGTLGFLAAKAPARQFATAQGIVAVTGGITMAGATALSGVLFAAFGSIAYAAMASAAVAGGAAAYVAHRAARNMAS